MTPGRLRLGVDMHTVDGIYQGSRSHLLGLYREAIVQAPDIEFVFLLAQPDRLQSVYPQFSSPNVRMIDMPRRPGPWRLLWQLAALQRRHRLDLLHVQYRLPFFPLGSCMCTLHDVLFETHPHYFSRGFVRMARWSARAAVRRASITLTVSDYSRQQIARCYPIAARSVILTPNGVDAERFHPLRAGAFASATAEAAAEAAAEKAILRRWDLASNGYLCSLGRLEPRKNHSTLVRAYARLPPDTPPLVIIGQRDFAYGELFERIRELHLEGRVRVLEDVDDDCLPVLLRHARLMAYPSQAEGFGMPVLEALASGVPVITSNTTSLPEVAGEAAWLISPTDVGGWAQALRDALAEAPAARQARIERGLAHASKFDWAASARSLVAAVRQWAADPWSV